MKARRLGGVAAATIGAWAALSCSPASFQDASVVASVRILAAQSEPADIAAQVPPTAAYAAPGSSVTVKVLAFDGRPATMQPEPMNVYFVPLVCENPKNDAYYQCFQQLAGGGGSGTSADGGTGRAPGGGAAGLPTGVDLTPFLPKPNQPFTFTMPSDAITAHPMVAGMPLPYGLVILFNVACAGHLELVPLDPANIQSPPIGCFDPLHNRLGPNDYVIGFTRVYAYDPAVNTNNNPVIDSLQTETDPQLMPIGDSTYALPKPLPRCGNPCPKYHIGPNVPDGSWEPDPEQRDVNGNKLHEQIWAEYFSTFGSFDHDVHLLFDAASGRIGGESRDEFTPPNDPGNGFIWIVVHDNRGGTSWATVSVSVN